MLIFKLCLKVSFTFFNHSGVSSKSSQSLTKYGTLPWSIVGITLEIPFSSINSANNSKTNFHSVGAYYSKSGRNFFITQDGLPGSKLPGFSVGRTHQIQHDFFLLCSYNSLSIFGITSF